jgi:MFS family permease
MSPFSERMSPLELQATLGLAGIFALRMLGLFIVLPVFAVYAEHLPGGNNHTLIGLALGAYGLTQAILQIPFGWVSDRYGRKPVIYWGLILFAAGSFIAALASDIYLVILGRVVQGAGAISAVVMALTADLTREEHRTKAMAAIGMTIGATFAASLVLAPPLNRLLGVPGIFALTGVLALAAMAIVYWVVPDPRESHFHSEAEANPAQFGEVLRHPELLRLNAGVFVLHGVLMAMWVVVPFALKESGLPLDHHWQVYLPVLVVSVLLMLPAIIWGERGGHLKAVFLGAVAVVLVSQAMLAGLASSFSGLVISLLVFFTGFNLLEATLPSIISRVAPVGARGTAIGVYSTVQFLGTFVGAAAGGFVSEYYGGPAVFLTCAALSGLWLALAAPMTAPPAVRTRMYHVSPMDDARADGLTRRLGELPGVREALVRAAEGVAYLKVDVKSFDEQRALQLLGGEA